MGANSIINEARGFSAKNCYEDLVEDAVCRFGNDPYNGTISTCFLGKCTQKYSKYTEKNKKKAYDFIDLQLDERMEKGAVNYVDLGPVEYHAITFKKIAGKKVPSYKMCYVVKESIRFGDCVVIKSFDNKKKADDFALKLAMKERNKEYITTKEYVLVEGDSTVTEIEAKTSVYKSKPNLKPLPNRIVVPVHKYIFYGWASC